jgi:hypothetical protein
MFRLPGAPILRSTTAAYSHRCVYGCGILVQWSRYWLGHRHTFSTVNFRLKFTVLKVRVCTEYCVSRQVHYRPGGSVNTGMGNWIMWLLLVHETRHWGNTTWILDGDLRLMDINKGFSWQNLVAWLCISCLKLLITVVEPVRPLSMTLCRND